MSLNARLASLEDHHRSLEEEIKEERAHVGSSDITLSQLKKRKLYIKEEIERLRTLV